MESEYFYKAYRRVCCVYEETEFSEGRTLSSSGQILWPCARSGPGAKESHRELGIQNVAIHLNISQRSFNEESAASRHAAQVNPLCDGVGYLPPLRDIDDRYAD